MAMVSLFLIGFFVCLGWHLEWEIITSGMWVVWLFILPILAGIGLGTIGLFADNRREYEERMVRERYEKALRD